MVTKLDESIGSIVEALEEKDMLQNSIIVFMSDNGAASIGSFTNWGSNYPLRGIKDTLFEGGVRDAAFIWSPLIVQSGRVSNDLVHVTDWLPTLLTGRLLDCGVKSRTHFSYVSCCVVLKNIYHMNNPLN